MNQTSKNATIQSDLNLQKSILEQRVEELRLMVHRAAVNFADDVDAIAKRFRHDARPHPTNLYQGAAEIDSLTRALNTKESELYYIINILARDAVRRPVLQRD